jgi:hypothetical protein
MSKRTGPPLGRPSDLIERAAAAYAALADLAETVEDEWQYITNLGEAYLPALRALSVPAADNGLEAAMAVDEAIAEIGSITDPHKAIDWLSTFPHLVALAVGGDVDGLTVGPGPGSGSGRGGPSEPELELDEDSPFRILLRGDI